MAESYPNPEVAWHAEYNAANVDYDEIAIRVPNFTGNATSLSGGLANDTFRLGEEQVLRIYRRDPLSLVRERELLSRSWSSFRVPRVLDHGSDFLLLEYVPHAPLENTAEQGDAVGRALGEIHQTTFDGCGLFGDAIELQQRWDDFVDQIGEVIASHVESFSAHTELFRDAADFVMERKSMLDERSENGVLLHGDFKPTNLHWASDGRLLVLDWEFTYAGLRFMDIGQLVRFGCPEPFRESFVDAYTASGSDLPTDWEARSRVFDLVNLVGLLRNSKRQSRCAQDCRQRIEDTLRA